MRRVWSLALSVVAAAALAGCAGDDAEDAGGVTTVAQADAEELERRVDAARDEVSRALERIARAGNAEELEQRLEEAAEDVRGAADEVADAEAAEELRAPRERLADAMRRLADDFEQSSEDVAGGEWVEAATRLAESDASRDVDRALAELRERGVEVEGLDRTAVGGTDAAAFAAAARAAQEEVESVLGDLADVRSPGAAADVMEGAAEELRERMDLLRAARLEGTYAPLAEAQRELGAALGRFADELERAAPNVRSGDLLELLRQVQALAAVEDVRRALDEVRRQGFDVPRL